MSSAKLELLAPAGNTFSLYAAIENGADAVYLGGKDFSARQYAENFTEEELEKAVKYAHNKGVKVYVTVNILVAESELKKVAHFLNFLSQANVDAVIVQDLGVIELIKDLNLHLPLHASTQMTIHNLSGVKFLEDVGFKRVTLARELTLKEINKIRENTKLELEIFIHGALCFSYSGLCLFSSMVGGRSGNRGRCTQPCRLPYQLIKAQGDKSTRAPEHQSIGKGRPIKGSKFFLSTKDLCLINYIPQLIESKIDAFKIEGRMKRPEYVAVVTRIYREVIDRYLEGNRGQKTKGENFFIREEEERDLYQIFNRGFTTGYLLGNPGEDLMSPQRPNNRGVYLGRVIDYKDKEVKIRLENDLSVGDKIEVWVSKGGRKEIVVNKMQDGGKRVTKSCRGSLVTIRGADPTIQHPASSIQYPVSSIQHPASRIQNRGLTPLTSSIRQKDRVFKVEDKELIKRARESFLSKGSDPTRGPSLARGLTPLTPSTSSSSPQTADYGLWTMDYGPRKASSIQNRGLTPLPPSKEDLSLNVVVDNEDSLKGAIRGGAEGIYWEGLVCHPQEGTDRIDLQKARRIITYCQKNRVKIYLKLPTIVKERGSDPTKAPSLELDPTSAPNLIRGLTPLTPSTSSSSPQTVDYGLWAMDYGPRKASSIQNWGLPPPIKEIESFLLRISNLSPDAILVGNLGTLRLAKEKTSIPIFADYPLGVFNPLSVKFLAEQGVKRITLSPELNLSQIKEITKKTNFSFECLICGFFPLIISEHCLVKETSLPVCSPNRTGRRADTYLPHLSAGPTAETGKGDRQTHKEEESYALKDRKGFVFPLKINQYNQTYLFNAKSLSLIEHLGEFKELGIDSLRIETNLLLSSEVEKIVRVYRECLERGFKPEQKRIIKGIYPQGTTTGHYYRGVT